MVSLTGQGLLSSISGLILLILAMATDFWMQYHYLGNLSHQGLWRVCLGGKCRSPTIALAFWNTTRAFMLLSIFSSFAGVLLGLTAFSRSSHPTWTRSAGITLLIAALFATLGLLVYTGVTAHFYARRFFEWRFSWSFILAWIGVILTIASGVFHLCAAARNSPPEDSNMGNS